MMAFCVGNTRRMTMGIIPRWKHLWNTWDLRGFIILSLCLQIILTLLAPLRKRTSTYLIIIPLWSSYLLADWVASYSLGLITKGKVDANYISNKTGVHVDGMDQDLIAFWAPFLLVHLGGSDTITAFALEDNEFWIRHLISLVIQCFGTVCVLVKTPPHNPLWVPTTLMFVNGIIKYSERTGAFYLASANRFKKSMNTNTDSSLNYMELMEKFRLNEEAKLATSTITQPPRSLASKRNLTELEVLQYAYCFFGTFKGLAVDLIFTQKTPNQSRDFFLNRTAKDAFEVVELELNFIYEVLFTKIPVLYSYFCVICRIFSFVTVCVAAILFVLESKLRFTNVDVRITYGLIFSSLVLDIVGLFVLVFSKRTLNFLLRSHVEGKTSFWTQFLEIFHVRKVKCIDFIFEELKRRSEAVDNLQKAMDISSSRGDLVLRDEGGWSRLLPYTLDVDYGQRVILWHIATDLCYYSDFNEKSKSKRRINTNRNNSREIAKLLSD
ncbi:uncharacterized protein [Rutidosis leptorrhynchoides]|uniref:uncharacterized protein n=1 Tax=Rutidosis leptorrhynchoides TaxID=125765 RepID=UPI003A99C719